MTADAPLRLGSLSFINSLPITCCLGDQVPLAVPVLLYEGAPTLLNQAVTKAQVDVSPVSSAYYLRNRNALILLDDLSISANTHADSVLLFSRFELNSDFPAQLLLAGGVIAVPDDSETSLALLKGMLHEKTGHDLSGFFRLYPAGNAADFLNETGCVLVIGDHALRLAEDFKTSGNDKPFYCYDLASLWYEQTGLPFVFAVWVARTAWLEESPRDNALRLRLLNQALCSSRNFFFSHADAMRRGVQLARKQCRISEDALLAYYTNALSYTLTATQKAGLERFNHMIQLGDPPACEPTPQPLWKRPKAPR